MGENIDAAKAAYEAAHSALWGAQGTYDYNVAQRTLNLKAPAYIRELEADNARLKELVAKLTPSAVLEAIRAGNYVTAPAPTPAPDTAHGDEGGN